MPQNYESRKKPVQKGDPLPKMVRQPYYPSILPTTCLVFLLVKTLL